MQRAAVLHPQDNVATALADLSPGDVVEWTGRESVTVREPIPFGHKLALCDIVSGGQVTKYGHSIGRTTAFVGAGSCVHVHNMESLRGRGDWTE